MFLISKYQFQRIQTILLLLTVCVNLNAQIKNYFKKDSIILKSSVELYGGVLQNQASIGYHYYNINKKPVFNFTVTAIKLNNFSLLVGGGYREKAVEGFGNNNFKMLFHKNYVYSSGGYGGPAPLNFRLNYVTIDLALKSTFFLKSRIQPFVFYGLRYNIITSYKYEDGVRSADLNNIILNLKKRYFNIFYGLGINYKLNNAFKIFAYFEINNDVTPLNGWKNGWFANLPNFDRYLYVFEFHNYSLQLGVSYTFQRHRKIKGFNVGVL